MLSEIALGQYFPGNSALHRMDPRVKIVCLLFFMVGIFVFSTAASYALFSAVLVCLLLSKTTAKFIAFLFGSSLLMLLIINMINVNAAI